MMADCADNHWLHPQDPSWSWRVSTHSVNAIKNHAAGEGALSDGWWLPVSSEHGLGLQKYLNIAGHEGSSWECKCSIT